MTSADEEKKCLDGHFERLFNSDDLKGRLILARDASIKAKNLCRYLLLHLPEVDDYDDYDYDCYDDTRCGKIDKLQGKFHSMRAHIISAIDLFDKADKIFEEYKKENKEIEE